MERGSREPRESGECGGTYVFELSGENEELAAAEVRAVAEAEGLPFEPVARYPGLLLAETGPAEPFRRLGTGHRVLRLVDSVERPEEFETGLELSESFSVRAKRMRGGRRDLSPIDVEREIGSVLVDAGGTVDLESPERKFRAVLSREELFVGEELLELDRSFAGKRPHQRPFFHPGAVEPVTARAMVNLARAGGDLLNPMCGNGSLLIEAAKVGAKPFGLDADPAMVNGTLLNVEEEGFAAAVVTGDARSLPFRDDRFDSAVADPPYGRSVKVYGEDVYGRSMEEMERVLRPGGYMVVAAPRPLDGADERYEQRVHRSLTRYVNVFRCHE